MLRPDVLQVTDPDPTGELWEVLAADVARYLGRRVEPDAVDDLRQEVFARVHAGRDALREASSVAPWVFRIARSVAVDHLRRRRAVDALDADLPDPGDDALAPTDHVAAVLGPWLAATVRTLPAPYAEAIRWVELEGITQKEAACRAGVSYTAMKSRVQRGRTMLRAALLRCCEVERDVRGRVIDFRARACDPGDACC